MKYSDAKNIAIIWLTRVIVPLVMLIPNVIIYKMFDKEIHMVASDFY